MIEVRVSATYRDGGSTPPTSTQKFNITGGDHGFDHMIRAFRRSHAINWRTS